ncbi:DUF1803 domain-containing protein [Streptococcus sp. DD12]|uniref:DUF1803 domain-containing protein n=1 Tax=Streptococcus sp. DD12 TaxID=1777880 RepID=UPI00079AAB34|nr:DUF1803 domain-containing protein [Streptococcus sp. DD12]KXT75580.1 hypothetical protein STRDD12_01391 [Streptococcus sp. DD12]
MFEIIHPSQLAQDPFFRDIITFLLESPNQTLRAIKKAFPDQKQLDRQLDRFIDAGYILRAQKRYQANIPWLTSLDGLALDQELFIPETFAFKEALADLRFETRLTNQTNAVVLCEETDIRREALTLANFFAKANSPQQLTQAQQRLYDLLGDVNPEYALKYLTTFLVKFVRKEVVLQKRPDIFVQALVALGYIKEIEPNRYSLLMTLDKEQLVFTAPALAADGQVDS